jgi:hypothetical protein
MNANSSFGIQASASALEPKTPRTSGQGLRSLWRADFFSPKDFIRRAIFITFLFVLAELFGLKEFTSILNGTTGSVVIGWTTSALLGLSYIFLYLAFVLLVPVLLLAATILVLWRRFGPAPRPSH